MRTRALLLSIVSSYLAFSAAAQQTQSCPRLEYRVRQTFNIGPISDLNSFNEMSGSINPGTGTQAAFISPTGVPQYIPFIPGFGAAGDYSSAVAINDRREVIGGMIHPFGGPIGVRGFLYNGLTSTVQEVHPNFGANYPDSSAQFLNERGDIVGHAYDPSSNFPTKAYFRSNQGVYFDIAPSPPSPRLAIEATDLSDTGEVVGVAEDLAIPGVQKAFRWSVGGGFKYLAPYTTGAVTLAQAIDEHGSVYGVSRSAVFYQETSVIWDSNGRVAPVPALASKNLRTLNAAGTGLGYTTTSPYYDFVFENGCVYHPQRLLQGSPYRGPEWEIYLTAINDADSMIAEIFNNVTFQSVTVRLEPR